MQDDQLPGEQDPDIQVEVDNRPLPQGMHYADVSGLGIGLAGAHRTGKTTIAMRLAQENDFAYVPSVGVEVSKDMGIDISQPLPFDVRMAYQEERMRRQILAYEQHNTAFISDRTPLDLAAYLIQDIPNNLTDPDLIARAMAYVDTAFEATNRLFFTVAMVQPGIKYKPEPGKPLPNGAYQEAINTIIHGLVTDLRFRRNLLILNRACTNIDERCGRIAHNSGMALAEVVEFTRALPAS